MESSTPEQPIGRYRQSAPFGILMIVGGAMGMSSTDVSPVWLSVGVVLFVLGVLDIAINAWRPPVILYPSRIVLSMPFPRRAREVRFAELLGWVHTKSLLGFESVTSARSCFWLGRLRKADRARLLDHLRSLLGDAGKSISLSRYLDRRGRLSRRMQVGSVAFAVAIVLVTVVRIGWVYSTMDPPQRPSDEDATPSPRERWAPPPPRAE